MDKATTMAPDQLKHLQNIINQLKAVDCRPRAIGVAPLLKTLRNPALQSMLPEALREELEIELYTFDLAYPDLKK